MEVPNALFIIVPPSMVSSLGGTELLPILLKQKQILDSQGPIVLVLEDADECLVPRGNDNMSSISSILNLGDGILGSLLDVRIVATTNAKKVEMDPAILRDCRLSKRIEVQPMPYDKANNIFMRLIKSDSKSIPTKKDRGEMYPKDKLQYTLAEVYRLGREHGWEPPTEKEQKKSHLCAATFSR
jgi:hypothetical protein